MSLNREFLVKKFGSEDKLYKQIVINVSCNGINRIEPNTFKGLGKLERLILSKNEIEEIDLDAIEGLSNLKILQLDNNKLRKIDPRCFEPLSKKIEVLTIFENVLKVYSFYKLEIWLRLRDEVKLTIYKFYSDWNAFLDHINIIFYQFKSPRLLISDYYDSLITNIDIYTEELLEKYSQDAILPLSQILNQIKNRTII